MLRAVFCAVGLGAALVFVVVPAAAQQDDGFVSNEQLEVAEPADEPGPNEKAPLQVATTPTPPVEHPPPERTPPGLGDCTFLSEPVCPLSLVAELGMAGGQSQSNVGLKDYGHFFLETGVLARTPGIRDLHIGPVFELAVEVNDIAVAWTASPRMRARYFVAGTELVLEGGFGPGFQRFAYTSALETGTRVGAVTDFSFGWRGIVGPFAQLGALHDVGGNDGTDLRWLAGIRANLLGWGYAFAAGFSGGKIF
jgi:hypothetical protein